jgi:4-hydroxy-3-methylbut-2-enyl diphosphate reductase
VTVFSAHGVTRKVEDEARTMGLQVIDATCPLVAKVHKEGRRYIEQGYEVILIGHAGHPEVVGTLGQIPGEVHLVANPADVAALTIAEGARVAYVTQTTLSVGETKDIIAAITARWPNAAGPDTRDICYATQNRQQAVIDMVGAIDLLLVAGATNSSNSNRLREIGQDHGVASHLIGDAGQFRPEWLEGVSALGVTAGASAPEVVVQEILSEIGRHREIEIVERDGVRESIVFRLPRELDEIAPDGVQQPARARAG